MKNDFLKIALLIVGLIVVAVIMGKAFLQGKLITKHTQLAALKLEHEHKEKMADKFIQLHRQMYSAPHCYVAYPHDIKPVI